MSTVAELRYPAAWPAHPPGEPPLAEPRPWSWALLLGLLVKVASVMITRQARRRW